MRKTKIICTMGPALRSEKKLESMIKNGMDAIRFNFSHGTREGILKDVNLIKKVRAKLKKDIPLILDTKGPEVRLKKFKEGQVSLVKGNFFILDNNEELGDETRVATTFSDLHKKVKKGTKILVDDGNLVLKVVEIKGESIKTAVMNNAIVKDRKGINIPSIDLGLPYISKNDLEDLRFGIENDFDFIAASFVRSAEDVVELKKVLKKYNGEKINIISKIESPSGLKNIDEILKLSDGIMIARGDLGVELAFEDIPRIQKDLISKAIKAGKMVVTATQMLESMITNIRPTRAEVSDVANAIYDGTTAIMLSGETAVGKYPLQTVKCMAGIAKKAEKDKNNKKQFAREELALAKDIIDTTCLAACYAADYISAKGIVVVTRSGRTARYLSNYRPNCPIVALTVDEKARRQLNLFYDVVPYPKEMLDSLEEVTNSARAGALKSGMLKKGDYIVIVIGSDIIEGHPSDTVRIMKL